MSGVAAVILAAGLSRRMGGRDKLMADVAGQPMRDHVVRAALGSRARWVVLVTGPAGRLPPVPAGGPERPILAINPRPQEGLGCSLRVGLAALPADADALLVLLGDMPFVTASDIDALIAAHAGAAPPAICRACHHGRPGHPVLFDRHFFAELAALSGDRGARAVVQRHAAAVILVARENPGVLTDIDTPEDLRSAGR